MLLDRESNTLQPVVFATGTRHVRMSHLQCFHQVLVVFLFVVWIRSDPLRHKDGDDENSGDEKEQQQGTL